MPFAIVSYEADVHEAQAVEVLLRLRGAGLDYPPRGDAPDTSSGLRSWLVGESVLGRWVAVEDDVVVGHVQLTVPHDYLIRHFSDHGKTASAIAEVGKLWVAPEAQGRGIGHELLVEASTASLSMNRVAVLAVLPASESAIRLYRRAGWSDAGSFEGVHGHNLVMRFDQSDAAPA